MAVEEGRAKRLYTFPQCSIRAPRLYYAPRFRKFRSLLSSHIVEEALRATEYIMNDDLEGAEAGLAHGTSSFHKVYYLRLDRFKWRLI